MWLLHVLAACLDPLQCRPKCRWLLKVMACMPPSCCQADSLVSITLVQAAALRLQSCRPLFRWTGKVEWHSNVGRLDRYHCFAEGSTTFQNLLHCRQPHVKPALVYAIRPTALLLFIPEYHIKGLLHLADRAGLVCPPRSSDAEPDPRDPYVLSERRKLRLSVGRPAWLLLPGPHPCLPGRTCWHQPRARASSQLKCDKWCL